MLERRLQIARQPGVDFNSLAMGGSSALEMGRSKNSSCGEDRAGGFVFLFYHFCYVPSHKVSSGGFIWLY